MVIRKLTASFGKLQGETLELQPGLNVIQAPNESGKSTWCAFIRAMLYGVDSSAREKGGVLPVKVKYAPWSGAPMEGQMELEWQGKEITLTRKTAQKNAPMREFSAVYTGSQLPVQGLNGRDAGEQLTGATAEVFDRSAMIRQGEIPVTGSPELEKRITSLVFSGQEDTAFSDGADTLRAWQRKRRRALEQIGEQLTVQQAENGAEAALQQAREETARQLSLAEETVRRLRQESAELRRQQRKDALRQMSEDKNRRNQVQETYASAMETERAAAARLEDSPFAGLSGEEARRRGEADLAGARRLEQETEQKLSPAVLLCLLGCVACLLLGIFWKKAAWIGSGMFLAGAALFWGVQKKSREQARQKLRNLLAYYRVDTTEELELAAERYVRDHRLWQAARMAMEQARQEVEETFTGQSGRDAAILGALDFETGVSAAASAGRRLKQAEELVGEYRAKLANLDGQLARSAPAAQPSGELEQRQRQLLREQAAIELALQTLTEADEEIQRVFSPKLSQAVSRIMGGFTAGKYETVTLDRTFAAHAQQAGDTVARRSGYLSAGTADLLYLAVRLAVCELLFPDGQCPLILDDSLTNLDAERRDRVMDYLAQLAKTRQVIVFSCSVL